LSAVVIVGSLVFWYSGSGRDWMVMCFVVPKF